jgi:hypothetical protein
MRFSNSVALILLFATLFLTVDSFAQTAQLTDETNIEAEVARRLRRRELTDLASELAQKRSSGTFDLLIKLSVLARAGHRLRVRETLKEIAETQDLTNSPHRWKILQTAQKAIGGEDFAAQKIYYELFATGGDERTSAFIELWRKNGDLAELEKWLAQRARQSETWWREWLVLRQQLGTADEIYEELARKIRENPADFSLVEKYLQAVAQPIAVSSGTNLVINRQDIAWLAEVVPTDSAYSAYELATFLDQHDGALGAKLFEKSLSLPFTEKDKVMFGERAFRRVSMPPVVKNPEKQLRFWTKKSLAEIYLKTGQPQLAQPLVEELTMMDTSDIQTSDVFNLAGGVQASSGQRAVESKILQDEAENHARPMYWLNRARYYEGRQEHNLAWETYLQALGRFSYKPNDLKSSFPRVQILYDLKWYGDRYKKKETEEILRREFTQAKAADDADYLYQLLHTINDDFENLLDEFFVNRELLPQVLATRASWSYNDRYLISNVMERETWDAKKREVVWNQLSALARRDLKTRAFSLATAMTNANADRKAVPLLEECLKIAPKDYAEGLNFNREDVERELFDAYLKSGDWPSAEKMFLGGFSYWGGESGRIALAAAQNGKIADAVRLWKMHANFDRRNLSGLEALAKTEARPALREFYLEMKKRDALTNAPEKALRFLQ